MDETEHDGVRILGANEAAAGGSGPVKPAAAPPRSTPPPTAGTPSTTWDDDEGGWNPEWLATDGDLDVDDQMDPADGAYADAGTIWGDEPTYEAEGAQGRIPNAEGYSAPAAASPPILRFEDDEAHDDGRDSWSTFTNKGPRWRSGGDDFDDEDEAAVASLGSPQTRVGTLDPDRGEESDLYAFARDDGEGAERAPEGPRKSGRAGGRRPAERSSGGAPRPPLRKPGARRAASLGMRVATGALLMAVFFGVLAVFKEKGGVALVALVAVLGVFEFYTSLRQRGFQPAVLPGAVTTLLLPIAAYSEGSVGIVITLLLSTLTTLVWYLVGVVRDRPAVNMAVTLLGVLYVGLLAGTAGLFLASPHGVGILIVTVVGTVIYDMVGFFVGANLGRRPLAPDISPNKTIEGLLGGCFAAVIGCVVLGKNIMPWSDESTGVLVILGIVLAVMAPLGDLTESMIKRDLGIKDMGSILPGHGGVLDRVDAMLFAVPAVYCIARWQGWA